MPKETAKPNPLIGAWLEAVGGALINASKFLQSGQVETGSVSAGRLPTCIGYQLLSKSPANHSYSNFTPEGLQDLQVKMQLKRKQALVDEEYMSANSFDQVQQQLNCIVSSRKRLESLQYKGDMAAVAELSARVNTMQRKLVDLLEEIEPGTRIATDDEDSNVSNEKYSEVEGEFLGIFKKSVVEAVKRSLDLTSEEGSMFAQVTGKATRKTSKAKEDPKAQWQQQEKELEKLLKTTDVSPSLSDSQTVKKRKKALEKKKTPARKGDARNSTFTASVGLTVKKRKKPSDKIKNATRRMGAGNSNSTASVGPTVKKRKKAYDKKKIATSKRGASNSTSTASNGKKMPSTPKRKKRKQSSARQDPEEVLDPVWEDDVEPKEGEFLNDVRRNKFYVACADETVGQVAAKALTILAKEKPQDYEDKTVGDILQELIESNSAKYEASSLQDPKGQLHAGTILAIPPGGWERRGDEDSGSESEAYDEEDEDGED